MRARPLFQLWLHPGFRSKYYECVEPADSNLVGEGHRLRISVREAALDPLEVGVTEKLGVHGVSTTDLADGLDISRQYLSGIENGAPNLLAKRLFGILNALKIRVTLTYEPKTVTGTRAADSEADDQLPG